MSMNNNLSSAAKRYMSKMNLNLFQPDDEEEDQRMRVPANPSASHYQLPAKNTNLFNRRTGSYIKHPVTESRSLIPIAPTNNILSSSNFRPPLTAYVPKTTYQNENQDPARKSAYQQLPVRSSISTTRVFSTTPASIEKPLSIGINGSSRIPTTTSSNFFRFSPDFIRNGNPGATSINTFKPPVFERPTIQLPPPPPSRSNFLKDKVSSLYNIPYYLASETQAINDKTYVLQKDMTGENFQSFTCDDSADLFGLKDSNERMFGSELSVSSDFKQISNNFEESFSSPPLKKWKGNHLNSLESDVSMSYESASFSKSVDRNLNIPTEILFNDASMRCDESVESIKIKEEQCSVVEIVDSTSESIKQVPNEKDSSNSESFSNPETTINSTFFEDMLKKRKKQDKVVSQKQTEKPEERFSGFDANAASEPIINPFNKNIHSQFNTSFNSAPIQATSVSRINNTQPKNAGQLEEPVLSSIDELFNSFSLTDEDENEHDISYNSKDKQNFLVKRRKIDTCLELDKCDDIKESIKIMDQKREEIELNYEIGAVKKEPVNENEDEIEDDCNISFDFGEIKDTIEEMEESFRNPTLSFRTSTPERSVEIKMEIMTVADLEPMNTHALTVASEISHISSSVPLEENYQFSLNSILNITQKNLTPQEGRIDASNRFGFLQSLIEEEGFLDSYAIPERVDKDIANSRRAVIMSQIEGIILVILQKLVSQKSIVIKIKKVKDFQDCTMADDILSQRETAISMRYISMTNFHQERTFTILVYLLCEIYKMLTKGTSCTRRELYYRDVGLMLNQSTVNRAIEDICILLNVLPWEIAVLSSSKGLMAGDLQLTMADGERIECSLLSATVPQNPSEISDVKSEAEYILVVEKDTVFTRLIQDRIFDKINSKIILITGKGYPDINTRVLLKRLEKDLRIPIYIVVDADPHGIEIMCTYKFGSLHMIHNSEALAVKSIEWIGVYPSDIEPLDMTHTKMTAAELKKVNELLKRPYLNSKLILELNCLKERQVKAEIEGLYEQSSEYFIKDFIPSKILGLAELMEILSQKTGRAIYKTKKTANSPKD